MSDSTPKVVMVDDDRSQLRILKGMLERQGFSTHSVSDSREAIAQIRRVRPKVVLVDISMPHLNGYQIAQQIRRESAFDAVLIVSVSSITGAEHDRIATAAGIDRQITKPICPRTLESAITAGLAQREKVNRAS